jgi:hypothetical protein
MIPGDLNKHSVVHREEEEILAVQGRDGELKQEQEDFLCSEMKMTMTFVISKYLRKLLPMGLTISPLKVDRARGTTWS